MSSTLLLVDGYAGVYRAFYAIKGLSNSAGVPTNAVFGFVRMISQLKENLQPTHLAVVFDGGLPEERMELVPEYKAQRPSMPDDLEAQLELIDRYLDAANILEIEVDGEEADDVLASLAHIYSNDFDKILIATGDKDLYQVVNNKVNMVSLTAGNKLMGPGEVFEKTGVTPAQTLEWLAMIGDSADNIDGVPGVGVKTATRLLAEFGDIDNLYKRIHDVTPDRIRNSLIESRDILLRNIDMIRLKRGIDCIESAGSMAVSEPDNAKLLALYEELEFTALAKALREPELF